MIISYSRPPYLFLHWQLSRCIYGCDCDSASTMYIVIDCTYAVTPSENGRERKRTLYLTIYGALQMRREVHGDNMIRYDIRSADGWTTLVPVHEVSVHPGFDAAA